MDKHIGHSDKYGELCGIISAKDSPDSGFVSQCLNDYLSELSYEKRRLFTARYCCNIPTAEIARLMKTTRKAVEAQLSGIRGSFGLYLKERSGSDEQ